MTGPRGSRWYFPLFEGLVDAKHQAQMGPAVWLYIYLVKYAFVANEGGILDYSHVAATEELGANIRTVKRWFKLLQEYGYITTRARKPYHLEVEVTNWRTVEEWHDTRKRDGEVTFLSQRSDKRSDMSSDKNGTTYTIAIKLQSYSYPSGSENGSDTTCLADAFRNLMDSLKTSKNKAATLRQIYRLCFGGDDETLPDYGYLGKVATKVGGAARFAQIMWELSTRPPADPMGFIMSVHGKGAGHVPHQRDSQADRRRGKVPESATITDELWASAKYADGADG